MIVGLGGGSRMDTAKGCNFLLTNGGEMQDYWGVGKATKPMLPLIAVPTTAGTGSECQSFALIADEDDAPEDGVRRSARPRARVALLDPALTLSQPPRVTACTGMDAIAHAVETAVTKKRNAVSADLLARGVRAVHRRASTACCRARATTSKRAATMQLGAAFAGTAIENSMLGAAHSAANPLTAHYGIVHGQAVGLMLPHVMRFNAEVPEAARLRWTRTSSPA